MEWLDLSLDMLTGKIPKDISMLRKLTANELEDLKTLPTKLIFNKNSILTQYI